MSAITPIAIYPGATSVVATGGTAVIAVYGEFMGGTITNPAAAADQGIPAAEDLYVSIAGMAGLVETSTTVALQPGQSFQFAPGQTTQVSVNAVTSGHKFSVYSIQTPQVFPPDSTGDTFPPANPTVLQQTINSYLYQEYNDDNDLQAFVDGYNQLAQGFISWFSSIGLPVYTGAQIINSLLDWVAEGLYGITRPYLPSGKNKNLGPLNTYAYNTLPFNTRKVVGPQDFFATNDDVFKRVITWHFFKGDGKVFNIRWLKRRIMRFLNGVNGTSYNIDETYPISVTFSGSTVFINILPGTATVVGGSIFNEFQFNGVGSEFNDIETLFVPFPTFDLAPILQAAIESGVLELPFQYTYVVNI